MEPEDRVLVGVINRKRDLDFARDAHWYRIPQGQMPRGVYAEYLAFFLSGAFGSLNGAIRCYARRKGVELAYRRDLLPDEAKSKRADDVYYRVELGDLIEKAPPVLNRTRRSISFIYTTWDRFVTAREIGDLYSENDVYVDRIYHALRDSGFRAERFWEAERSETGRGAHVRILCENGPLFAAPDPENDALFMDEGRSDDAILTAIKAEIARQGGPVTLNIPLEGR